MVLPSDVILASLYLPAVTNARASDDYAALRNWDIGATSLLMTSVGNIRPSKDNFWTNPQWPQGFPRPSNPAFGDPSLNLDLHSLVAVLSTGPVGPSDLALNKTILQRMATTDGVILSPQRPLGLLNVGFREQVYSSGLRLAAAAGVNGFRGFLAGGMANMAKGKDHKENDVGKDKHNASMVVEPPVDGVVVRRGDFASVGAPIGPSGVVLSRNFFDKLQTCVAAPASAKKHPVLPKKGRERGKKNKKKTKKDDAVDNYIVNVGGELGRERVDLSTPNRFQTGVRPVSCRMHHPCHSPCHMNSLDRNS